MTRTNTVESAVFLKFNDYQSHLLPKIIPQAEKIFLVKKLVSGHGSCSDPKHNNLSTGFGRINFRIMIGN